MVVNVWNALDIDKIHPIGKFGFKISQKYRLHKSTTAFSTIPIFLSTLMQQTCNYAFKKIW